MSKLSAAEQRDVQASTGDVRMPDFYRLDEVHRLPETFGVAPIDYIQMRPGALGARIHRVATPRVEVRDASFDADLLLSISGPGPRFSFAVGVVGDAHVLGTRLTNSNASTSCGSNGFIARLSHHARWCNVSFDWELVYGVAAAHGYEVPSGDEAYGMPVATHDRFAALLRRVACGQALNHLSDSELEDELTLTVLRCLNRGKQPARIEPRRRWLLVHRIIDFIQAEYRNPITITELCRLAGVGERTLQYAFREATGITAQQYLMNYRLRQARSTLMRGEVGRVSDAARACGIPHLGRFAQYYRHMYGQSPQETLRAV